LARQILDQVGLLKLYKDHIEKVIGKISNSGGDTYIDIKDVKLLKEFYGKDKAPWQEIMELNSFGMYQIFDVREVEPPVDTFAAIAVAVLGIAQIAIGLACISTGHIHLAATFIISGVSDAFKSIGIANGEKFKWNEYFTDKAITVAVAVISIGVEEMLAGLGIMKEPINSAAEIAKEVEKHGFTYGLKLVAEEVGVRLLINKGLDWAADGAIKGAIAGFKDDI